MLKLPTIMLDDNLLGSLHCYSNNKVSSSIVSPSLFICVDRDTSVCSLSHKVRRAFLSNLYEKLTSGPKQRAYVMGPSKWRIGSVLQARSPSKNKKN